MLNNRIKTTIILPSLRAGGAERVMSFIADNLDQKKFDVTLLITGSSIDQAYTINHIKLTFLNQKRVLMSIPKLIRYIVKYKPHIVISSIGHLNLAMGLISFLSPQTVFVGRQTNISKVDSKKKSSLIGFVTRKGIGNCMETFGIQKDKLKIINNPITDNFAVKTSETLNPNSIIKLITVGRLVKVKGHVRVLEALSNFKNPFIYTIIGVGPEKDTIINKITALNLKDKVKFIEYTDNVAKYLSESDVFIQGSYSEGFPNALLESCAVGTPVVAYEAPGGTKEIIDNGINGFIVRSDTEFLDKIEYLLEHQLDPIEISKSVYNKYSKEVILSKYEQFLLNIVK